MARHNDTGVLGEELAAKYFTSRGYTLLHRNWRHGHWEMDLIASKDSVLHFIEVKTRTGTGMGFPEDDVDKRKVRYLMSAAEEYQCLHPGWKWIQLDILSILIEKNEPEYFLIEDVAI